jgi:hypothetical protein
MRGSIASGLWNEGIKYQDLGMKKKKLLFTTVPAKPGSPSLKLRLKSAPF